MQRNTRKVIVLTPRRRKVAAFIRKVKAFNRFFDLEGGTASDYAWWYGVLILIAFGLIVAVSAIIEALVLS